SDIFFSQAEDGIRYFHVTGVQTCALPILPLRTRLPLYSIDQTTGTICRADPRVRPPMVQPQTDSPDSGTFWAAASVYLDQAQIQIGRAACREKDEDTGIVTSSTATITEQA